jgi:hypothetical protein
MKVCTKCKVEKEVINFSKHKGTKSGFGSRCKECSKEYYKKYHEKNKNYSKEHRKKNKEYYKEYRKNNSEKNKEYYKKWREENKEKIKQNAKIYFQKNKEILQKKSYEYTKQKKQKDYFFKFKINIRSNIVKSFKRGTNQFKKDAKTEMILGCTIEEFVCYIQSLFTNGMTLENHGEWHLDHIIPLASVNTQEEIKKLCHYTNYQPLWAEENLTKSKKIIEKQLKLI